MLGKGENYPVAAPLVLFEVSRIKIGISSLASAVYSMIKLNR